MATALVAIIVALGAIYAFTMPSSAVYTLSCRSQRTAVYEEIVVNATNHSTISTTYTTQLGAVSTYTTTTDSSATVGMVIYTTTAPATIIGAVSEYVGITCTYSR